MMVQLHIICTGIFVDRDPLEFQAPEGATVEQALAEYARQSGREELLSRLGELLFAVNNKISPVDTPLNAGDEVRVIRLMGGG